MYPRRHPFPPHSIKLLRTWSGWPKKWRFFFVVFVLSDLDVRHRHFSSCSFSELMQSCKSKAVGFWHCDANCVSTGRPKPIESSPQLFFSLVSWILTCEIQWTQTSSVATVVWMNRFAQGWVRLASSSSLARSSFCLLVDHVCWKASRRCRSRLFFTLFFSFFSTERCTSAH